MPKSTGNAIVGTAEMSEMDGVRVLRGNRIVRAKTRPAVKREAKRDEEGNVYTKKHPDSGQRGRLLKLNFRDGSSETYLRKPLAREAQRARQRSGVQAKDLAIEAVYTNQKTSPRVEVPRVLVESLRLDVRKLTASDIAIWWRLFAEARDDGMTADTHFIQLSSIAKYVGIRSLDRIKASLKRLSAASLSYHGGAGRQTVPMLECPDVADLDTMSGAEWLHYSLPPGLRQIVLESTGFCRVDLNALPRFKSKFSAALYIRLCYEAGKLKAFHDEVHLSKEDVKRIVGLEATQAEVIDDAIERIREDLITIDGPRRRYHLEMYVSNSGKLVITFGSAQKRLLEAKPAYMTNDGIKALADRSQFQLLRHQYPSVVRLRQAETTLGVAAVRISELWRVDVQRASSKHPEGCIGYSAKTFKWRIHRFGADAVFAEWIEKRDFTGLGVEREELPDAQPFKRVQRAERRKKAHEPVLSVLAEAKPKLAILDGEDLRLGDDFGALEYGDIDPTISAPAADVDDMDIPF
ncbi:RepB family plasmid replication initiator protein [Rhizobium sp. CFBP 8752]|uniref:RepB family plasmid replication initiator protein n=1 Tax=Rhizobium sp. CFBP 8752 TaxID=2775301 RepID=UPI00177FA096|nr:RepB family plasmid replication initiator protein [Rhizobium sp. CFBP 8752]MBD8663053.1 RepB family plasmid replication initiator protein [Rhizobium sp. CFBP 8752]